ncbi:MAG TPA: hypothetical protein VLM19_00710 [Nitrospiraceae bacterium]|nr:hypothetical protein [Nitrospiraceae bacterium]
MKKANLAIARKQSPTPSTRSSITVSSWNDVLMLVREPDRHGKPVLFIRIMFGKMEPCRYGPFPSLKQAKACYREMVTPLKEALLDEISHQGDICSR